jgi:CheY-like chemotaxis protein/HPt (histidine-containing phosphotransfer) domain-containing protein
MIDPKVDRRLEPSTGRLPIVVLLVDDQPFTGSVLGMLLRSESDIELHCCLSALDAIAKGNEIAPTVVLQDLVMPDLDGLASLRSFQANPRTAGTPVIVLSGNDDADTRARAMAAGADAFLVKIPPRAQLIECIRHHASRSAGARVTLDPTVIDRFREAGPDFLGRLIDQFLQEAHTGVRTLSETAGRADAPAISTVAHSLKGSAMMMGASRLGALCARVEDQAALAPAGDVQPALVAEIEQEFVRVQHVLSAERERIVRS